MVNLKNIFNHSRTDNPDKDMDLYEWDKPVFKKDDVRQLNHFLKKLGRMRNATWHSDFFYSNAQRFPEWYQRVSFMASYSNTMKSHLRYIKKYLVQADKKEVENKPELFGTPIEEYEKNMVPLNFKFVISPESQTVNLEALTRTFIKQLEYLTGYEFYWVGAIHENTDNRHCHVAINGKDKHGKKVRFTKEMIKNQMRELLSRQVTIMIGERTPQEIEESKNRQVKSMRWTQFDEELKNQSFGIYSMNLRPSLSNRLSFLESIGLAKKQGKCWLVNSEAEDVLKATGRYNTFFEEYIKDDPQPLKLYMGGPVTGLVTRVITMDKDESNNDAVVIRTRDGRVYIPVFQIQHETLDGKIISVDSSLTNGIGKTVSDRDIHIVKNPDSRDGVER
ncbi:MAG: hypothetical protein HUK25_08315 [Treponema sp.]|nr:hypothetical protein [Treponema sp.]